jgi:hypothetical protein
MSTLDLTKTTPLYEIAQIVRKDWKRVHFGAEPYLSAMSSLSTINDRYMFDDAKSIVLYFLSNASTWKGDTAKQVKTHLKSLVK